MSVFGFVSSSPDDSEVRSILSEHHDLHAVDNDGVHDHCNCDDYNNHDHNNYDNHDGDDNKHDDCGNNKNDKDDEHTDIATSFTTLHQGSVIDRNSEGDGTTANMCSTSSPTLPCDPSSDVKESGCDMSDAISGSADVSG
eukprot:Phypoly_transcript_17810.p1 GENE.Phypoly_transcript_17810~~Phypoly_transcript_17810.p1  ORF type:complete len:140 (+),score=15.08 Phypoly_transcript_17810:287-706(+)